MSVTRIQSLGCTFALTLAACLLPGVAQAQTSAPQVRIAAEEAPVMTSRRPGAVQLTTVSEGGVYDVLHMAGDPYAYRETNWYLVSLPPDSFGRRHMGWVAGDFVQELPRVEVPRTRTSEPQVRMLSRSSSTSSGGSAPVPAAGFVSGAAAAAAPEPEPVDIAPVVVHFAFDKSDLSLEARSTLDCAMEMMMDGQAMSFAVEGHTDWTGAEAYNEKLGMARAEAVKSYLIEAHHIPMDQITVSSFGEGQPAASNDSADGRAMNRRVVVKVGG